MPSPQIIACSVDTHARIQRVSISTLFVPRSLVLTLTKQSLLVFGGDVKFDDEGEPIFPEGQMNGFSMLSKRTFQRFYEAPQKM